MRFYPFLLALIIWGFAYHGMYFLTGQFYTKSVAISGFVVGLLIPIGLSIGTYVIASTIQKKEAKK